MDPLFSLVLPTSFPLYKNVLLPCCLGTHMCPSRWKTLNCNFLLIHDKAIFAGEIPSSLFVSGQHYFLSPSHWLFLPGLSFRFLLTAAIYKSMILNIGYSLELPNNLGTKPPPPPVFFWRRKWQPTPVFLLGESHRQMSLEG